ncbi:ATP-binding protein [Vibrio vulnificus]|uniref:IS21-like element helper ATPase IstB n=6 Tax=Vibrio vulnificus TaxID=672 RepID=UPI0009B6F32C|nr:IS21-like element helper ATPase IstB [Vibrio vulnificus]EGR0637483.1 ATP-binding protein [Vibrio vulnificus]EIJ0948639.1 IS21-like element helper ATPase IstB [Vibrio vulnificus]EJD0676974.1 IS21-like element helper ATPase IstB [Vibrio vulnificus]EJZ7973427.1 IS21-like element helper ATPase IstB [Vibrio vulnificus]ELP6989710.1 IS21-like element helper ATPase IstB [Vibrio vulnificus]
MQAIHNQLTQLKLSGIKSALEHQNELPSTYQEMSFEERLSLLLDEELTQRENKRIARLLKQAHFRLHAELEELDYRSGRGLEKTVIRNLASGQWLSRKQNILLTGATGCGKTYLACALGRHLCRQGHSVYYFRLKNLLEECYQSHADGSYPKLLGKLAKSALLIIDDWGLEPLAADQRSDLLEIIDQHYQKGSILLISQLPIEEWHRMIGDATHADAILDRLVHGSIKVNLAGESMRKVCSQLTEGDQ